MQFTKALLVLSAFAPFTLAAEQATASTSTVTVQLVNAHPSSSATPSSTPTPSPSSTPIFRPSSTPVSRFGSSRWNATYSATSVPVRGPAKTSPAAAASSSALSQTGAAAPVQLSGALAAGAMAVAGLAML